jgi:hypothetical protein
MRYHTQLHRWQNAYVIALVIGIVCFALALFSAGDAYTKVGYAACGVFAVVAAWMLFRSRGHYLEISDEWIIHEGFTRWRVRKSEVLRGVPGRKGPLDDYDPCLKVLAPGQEFEIDPGFLFNERRVAELVGAMLYRPAK